MIKRNYFLVVLLIISFLSVDISSRAQSIRQIDRDILYNINQLDGPFISGYCDVMAASASVLSIGVPVSMFAYSFAKDDPKMRESSICIGASVATSFVISYILKNKFERHRPYESIPSINTETIEDTYSFPSSHSTVAFALATSLSLEYPKWYIIVPSYFWATSVGFARIQQGVHYPSDVIAGALLGTSSAFLCHELNLWINSSIKKKTVDTSWINAVYDIGY